MALSLFKSPGSKSKNTAPKQRQKAPKTVQESIPYTNVYKNGIIETIPGTFSKCYLLQDVNFKIASTSEQEQIFHAYSDLLNMFSPDIHIEITIANRTCEQERYFQGVLMQHKNDGLDEYRDESNKILIDHMTESSNNIVREKYLTISFEANSVDEATTKFSRLDAEVAAAVKKANGCDTLPMTIEQRLSILYDIYNVGTDIPLSAPVNKNGVISESFSLDDVKKAGWTTKDCIAPNSLCFKKDYFEMGDHFGRVVFLGALPSILNTEFFCDLSEVPCNMLASVHFEVLRQDKAVKLIRRQTVNINSNIVEAQKRAAKSGYSPDMISPTLRKSQEEAEKLTEDVMSRNQRLFLTTVAVCIFADNLEDLDKFTQSIQTTAQKHICILKKLSYQQENGLTTVLPLAQNKLAIKRLLTTESASLFIPFSAQELSQQGGLYYGCNAVSGNPIFFARTKAKNANGVILGTPGSGKSFAAKREMLNVLLGTDDDVFIIDPEREYAPLAALLGGEIVRIAAGSKNYVNPMDMDIDYADDDDPITLKSDFICSLCETMMGTRDGLSPTQKTVVDRCVRKLYQDYKAKLVRKGEDTTLDTTLSPTLTDLYDQLMAQREPEATNMALVLEMYTKGSLDLFAHQTNVNAHNRFIIYDIKDIGTGLKELGLQVCLNDIWNKIIANKKRGKRTWFYIDEFYLLTQADSSAKFLQQVYKRARKWGGVPTGITQNVEDLLSSKEARGIINNCDFIMMLNQSPLDKAELADMLNISSTQMEYISNADAGTGLLYVGAKSIIPFRDQYPRNTKTYAVMTTKPDEVNLQQVETQAASNSSSQPTSSSTKPRNIKDLLPDRKGY